MSKPHVNFEVLSCIHDVDIDFQNSSQRFHCKLVLRKIADAQPEDYWQENEWHADIPIESFRVESKSEGIVCSNPTAINIGNGRQAHRFEIGCSNNERVPVSDQAMEFHLYYEKPIRVNLNYLIVTPLPGVHLHYFRFDPFQMFNRCDFLSYRLTVPEALMFASGLPASSLTERDNMVAFSEKAVDADEAFVVSLLLADKWLKNKIMKKILKPILWAFSQLS